MTPKSLGPDFIVNTTTEGGQRNPSVAALADGRFVVAFSDLGNNPGDKSYWAVRAQVFNADGTKSGQEFLVNSTKKDSQYLPSVAGLSDGRFVIVFVDESQTRGEDSRGKAVRAQIFNVDGSKSGDEFLVNTTTKGDQTLPTVSALDNGAFVVTYSDRSRTTGEDEDGYAVRAQIFTPNGSKSGNEFLVNTTTAKDQKNPSVATLSDGRFVVVFDDESGAAGDDGDDVRAQMFNADGSKSGSEILINGSAKYNKWENAVAALADGGFVAAYWDWNSAGGGWGAEIRAQIINADGSKRGSEFLVNSTTTNNQVEPTISALADGGFVVAFTDWSQTGGDKSSYAVRAQAFNADGSKLGAEFLVNSTTKISQFEPSVTSLKDGRIVFAFADGSQTGEDTSNSAIRAAVFDPRTGDATIDGSDLDDDFIGSDYNDTIRGLGGRDRLVGGKGKDFLDGGSSSDKLFGGQSRDKLFGGRDNDMLSGGTGNDRIKGGGGDDLIVGGGGRDLLIGSPGSDVFVYRKLSDSAPGVKHDKIKDFQAGSDVIDLSAIDAGSAEGDQAFGFIGSSAFGGTEGELRFEQLSGKSLVQADVDGDGSVDFEIELTGELTLTAGEFIL